LTGPEYASVNTTWYTMLRFFPALVLASACTAPSGTFDAYTVQTQHTDSTYAVRTFVPDAVVDVDSARVLVVLDGDWYASASFRAVQRAIDDGLEAPVVVTVGYESKNARFLDYTPTEFGERPESGGLDAFIDVLEQDILPDAPGSDDRIVFGHSLAGLAVANLWFARSDLAPSVIAASPSFWWDDGVSFDRIPDERPAGELWMATGSQETVGMVGSAQAMDDELGDWGQFTLLRGRDHGSVVGPSLDKGLAHFLQAAP
jgi:predicted alpha/beta superfamily hydrolase